MDYFRKVTNSVLPRSRNKKDKDDTDTDDDDILFSTANTSKKKVKKTSLERQKSLKSKAEEVKILNTAVDNFRGKLILNNRNPFTCNLNCTRREIFKPFIVSCHIIVAVDILLAKIVNKLILTLSVLRA